jgi:hypothetical protein
MSRKLAKYFLSLSAALIAAGCSVTRHVPDGEYLLTRNKIVADKDTPKQDRVTGDDLERYIRQSPTPRFLGTNLYLGIYSLSSPEKDGWWHRTLRKIGAAPVILDTNLVVRSANNLTNYLISKGYYYSDNRYEIDTHRKKAKVSYYIKQNEPYRIRDVSYVFRDENLRPVIMQDSAATLLRSGERFDLDVLAAEEARIIGNLRDNGYYYFSSANDSIVADTMAGGYQTDLEFVFRKQLKGYDNQGRAIYEDNRVYRLDSIFIYPGYNPQQAAADPGYLKDMDTVPYRGLHIVFKERQNVRSRILRQAVNLQQNQLYSEADVRQAYADIMRLGYYKNANIHFVDKTNYAEPNLVTFVGSDGQTATVSEGYLSCYINCIPALRQSYKIELEGTTTSDYYGINASIGYQNRNLFRGVEMLDVTVRGGYEFMRAKGRNGSWELGAGVSLSFPRFISPIRIDRYNRLVNPRTRIELTVNSQSRVMYDRNLFGANWAYTWSGRGASSFTLRPIDINVIKMGNIDPGFQAGTIDRNPFLKYSFTDQIVAGISGSHIYNSQLRKGGGSWVLRTNAETAGNLIYGISNLFNAGSFSEGPDGKDYHKLFGIRYAQYFRVDASFSDRVALGPRTSMAYRVYAGGAMPYGNSASIPFDRLFYGGGSNSMRGWVARSLGPGNTASPGDSFPAQMANIKLEANLELRFPMWKSLGGAVFFDAGNIWLAGKYNNDEQGRFRFDTFYKQLGFNTGLGLRLDINVAVLRLDWGIKLHDPGRPAGDRWIDDFRYNNTALNFGVGYPF